MNREKTLVKNTAILTIGKICPQMITFFLLPLYTAILSTEEFGIVDLLNTLVSLLLPIITLFLLLQNWIIPLLYKSDFVAVAGYTTWAMPGVIFKAISWSLGFILLAKGEGKLFLITELISDVTSIVINILLYLNLGLEGLGIAYTINFIVYTIYMWIISVRRYNFKPEKAFYIVFLVSAILIYSQAVIINFEISKYLIPSLFATVATIYSIIALRKRLSSK